MPTETLTLRITGDSAPLQRELDTVEQRLQSFSERVTQFTDVGRGVQQLASRFADLLRPLDQVTRSLDRIASQLVNLGNIPVRLNVAPALQGLAAISQQIDQIAAKLAGLAAPRPFIPAPLPLPADPGPIPIPIRQFANGGYVTGPQGLDRIPSLLSHGEFVLRESAVRQLGANFLQQLNQGAIAPSSLQSNASSAPASISNSSITNVGGIALHVNQPIDLPRLVRNLQHQQFRLKTRRG